MKSAFYVLFQMFLAAPCHEMAPHHRQLCAPHITASGNALQALVDPPNISNEDHDDGGDESMEGIYLNSIANAARASTLLLESAQHVSFYTETFKLLMKEFAECTKEHLQDVSGSVICTQQVIQAVSVQLVNTLSSVSRITNKTSTSTHDMLMRLLTMENMLNHLLQQSDVTKGINNNLLTVYHASHEENGQLRTEIH
jgi:hypothetical protein